jgi:hypothetical protein
MNKIVDCTWGSVVEVTKTGYKLFSLDRSASVEILKCLMMVRVSYLEGVKDKSLVKKVRKE